MDRKTEVEIQMLKSQIDILQTILFAIKEELQNNIGQLLNSIKMIMAIDSADPYVLGDLKRIVQKITAKAIHDIRTLSGFISKECTTDFNMIAHLSSDFCSRNNVYLDTNLEDLPLLANKQ